MKLSPHLKAEKAYVQQTLGENPICKRCDATLGTYFSNCTAELCDPCPGFWTIENAKAEFAKQNPIRIEKP